MGKIDILFCLVSLFDYLQFDQLVGGEGHQSISSINISLQLQDKKKSILLFQSIITSRKLTQNPKHSHTMKGLQFRLQKTTSQIQATLLSPPHKLTLDIYLINFSKYCIEALQIAQQIIAFSSTNVEMHIPVLYEKMVGKLREAKRCKPERDEEDEEEAKGISDVGGDQIVQFLNSRKPIRDNKSLAELNWYVEHMEKKQKDTHNFVEGMNKVKRIHEPRKPKLQSQYTQTDIRWVGNLELGENSEAKMRGLFTEVPWIRDFIQRKERELVDVREEFGQVRRQYEEVLVGKEQVEMQLQQEKQRQKQISPPKGIGPGSNITPKPKEKKKKNSIFSKKSLSRELKAKLSERQSEPYNKQNLSIFCTPNSVQNSEMIADSYENENKNGNESENWNGNGQRQRSRQRQREKNYNDRINSSGEGSMKEMKENSEEGMDRDSVAEESEWTGVEGRNRDRPIISKISQKIEQQHFSSQQHLQLSPQSSNTQPQPNPITTPENSPSQSQPKPRRSNKIQSFTSREEAKLHHLRSLPAGLVDGKDEVNLRNIQRERDKQVEKEKFKRNIQGGYLERVKNCKGKMKVEKNYTIYRESQISNKFRNSNDRQQQQQQKQNRRQGKKNQFSSCHEQKLKLSTTPNRFLTKLKPFPPPKQPLQNLPSIQKPQPKLHSQPDQPFPYGQAGTLSPYQLQLDEQQQRELEQYLNQPYPEEGGLEKKDGIILNKISLLQQRRQGRGQVRFWVQAVEKVHRKFCGARCRHLERFYKQLSKGGHCWSHRVALQLPTRKIGFFS